MKAVEPTQAEVQLMRRYRKQGWSFDRVAEATGFSRNTIRKHASEGTTVPLPPAGAAVPKKHMFTQRQLEIAIAALEYRERNK